MQQRGVRFHVSFDFAAMSFEACEIFIVELSKVKKGAYGVWLAPLRAMDLMGQVAWRYHVGANAWMPLSKNKKSISQLLQGKIKYAML